MNKIRNFDLSGWIFRMLFLSRIKTNIFFFNWLIKLICYFKGVRLGKKIIFNGIPIIRRFPNSKIVLGDNCRFNSAKNSVVIGQQKRCAFATLRKNSEIILESNSGATGLSIAAAKKIKIGKNVLIGANCTILDNDFHHSDPNKRALDDYPARSVFIEDNVFIGFNCLILKGVTIGENSVIGANSVVINSIPKNSIAVGNPCKVIIKKTWEGSSHNNSSL